VVTIGRLAGQQFKMGFGCLHVVVLIYSVQKKARWLAGGYLFAFHRRVTLPEYQVVRHQPCRVKCAVIFRYLYRVNLRTS
ncbi:hypothetical protein, partial [Klebsiella pneumoniae]|uniref:hypothetical protein n=1 Tax=Klebsiella pneumoniae TaxID=573 RepID=UPI001F075D3D